jgi:hypothetical protein
MGKVGIIKLTQRMLTKSIIDANKSVVAFANENLPVDYGHIENGKKARFLAVFDDGSASELRLYRRPRGDELLSIKGLSKKAKAGDIVKLTRYSGEDPEVRVKITVEEEVNEKEN